MYERQQQRNQRRTFSFEKFQKERTLRVLYYMQFRYCSKNKNSRNEKELIRIKCNVHQSRSKISKIRRIPKKCANQNGRPSRSLKSKRKHTQRKKDPPRPQRRPKSSERRYSEAETSQYPSVVPSKPENRKNEPEKR